MSLVRRRASAEETPAEWELLAACGYAHRRDSGREKIKQLLQTAIVWERFCAAAERHKLEALVFRNLASTALDKVPAEIASRLESAARRAVQRGLLYTGRFLELAKLFESAGIAAIPYKGPVLGALAYGNCSLRSFQDLDFVLPQSQIVKASELLVQQGFRAYPDPTCAEQARFLRHFHPGQYVFVCDSKPPQIELHTERTLRYLPVPLDWKAVAPRLAEVSVSGRIVRTFSLEDTLVLLSVHGTKHFWERLSWVCDIAELIQAPAGVDWELGHELAKQAGCRRIWLLSLVLANRLLEAPLPGIVQDWIGSDDHVEAMARTIGRRLASGGGLPGAPQRLLFRLQSHERLCTGLSQCWRTATSPTEDDWQMCSLPEWATPLYFAVRPWRLLRQHGLGLRRKAA